MNHPCPGSIHITKQLLLQNIFSLFVLLRALVSAVVFPAHDLFALTTADVADDVSACGHVAFGGFALEGVYDGVEEVGFAVLAAEIPTYDFIVVGEVSLAVFAAVDAFGVEVDIVGEAHDFLSGLGIQSEVKRENEFG